MKLNLKRIKELEEEYKGNPISLNTLQIMIDTVLNTNNSYGLKNEATYIFSVNNLKDLRVIIDDEKPVQQLNS